MNLLFTMKNNSHLADICDALAADGYPSDADTARKVRTAFRRGALVWTATHLKTTDKNHLDLLPHAIKEPDGMSPEEFSK